MFAQPKTPEEARRLGLPEWQIKTMFPEQKGGGMIGAILNGGWDAGAQYDDPPGGLLAAESKPKGFWQGGDKFTGKDALAGLLAAVGDGLMMNAGGEGAAVGMLAGGRTKARDMAEKQAAQQAEMAQTMAILRGAYPNLTDAQLLAMATGNGNPSDFKPEKPKGLRPVPGPTGVFVWDADNERFVDPPSGANPNAYTGPEWEDIDDPRGGPTGARSGGFRQW